MREQDYAAHFMPVNDNLALIFPLPFPPKYVEIPLINLIDNAFQHCGQRRWASVQVSLELDTENPELPLVIRVEDTGFGMSQSQTRRLFLPRETSRGLSGSGMGLYLAKQLITSIGGIIELEKTVRWFGSCFIIRLPFEN